MSGELARVLEDVAEIFRRYVVMTSEQADTLALFTAHTWAFDAAEATPYIAVSSAEKRSGKSLVLEVAEFLVSRPWPAVTPSEAALYRKIDKVRPTLLLDEYDAVFHPKREAATEPIRAIINSGYREGKKVPRCVGEGKKQEVVDFDVFCPKVLAGIGDPPSTIRDRCIVLELKRKARGETVERFRRREAIELCEPSARSLESILGQHVEQLRDARPELPVELDDRAAEGWEPLLAIADLAGDDWPERARRAARTLSAGEGREDDSLGVRLLGDVRAIFDRLGVERIMTTTLLEELAADDEAAWSDWYGKPLTAKALARLLQPYGIKSKTIRVDDTTAKGYHRAQLEDAFERYLPAVPSQHTPVTAPPAAGNPHHNSDVTDVTGGDGMDEEEKKKNHDLSALPSSDVAVTPVTTQEGPDF